MGIIIGNQENVTANVEQPVVETPQEATVNVEQPAEEPVASPVETTQEQEAMKPARRGRKRK